MNYLALGDVIVDRLLDTINNVSSIFATIDLNQSTELPVPTPALMVYYIGDDLGKEAGNGMAYTIKQTWAVVIAVKNLGEANDRRAELGTLIYDVISSLQGWLPNDKRYGPLYRETSPRPLENPGGYVYFPLHFSSVFHTIGR